MIRVKTQGINMTRLLGPFVCLLYLSPLLLPSFAFNLAQGGLEINLAGWVPLLVMFGVIPLLDLLIGKDTHNEHARSSDPSILPFLFRAVPWLALPGCTAVLLYTAPIVIAAELSPLGRLGWILSVGVIMGSVGITAAHELIHKRSRFEQLSGGLLLSLVCYGSFKVEHIYWHHAHVATPVDPTTARYGQSIYRFLGTVYRHNAVNGWRLEQKRLKNRNLPPWSWHNQLLWYYGLSLLLLIGFWTLFGGLGALYFIGQSFFAITLLEIVNYIEHYGLQRKQRDGNQKAPRYEPVAPQHSWNASFRLSNLMLMQLQRHSDHHAHAARPYHLLAHHQQAPQLPAGYPALVLLALCPPLWRKVIHPCLHQVQPPQQQQV